MILERTKSEILVRLPASIDLSELQNMLDYLRYKELTVKPKAKQTAADELAQEANKSMLQKALKKRGLQ